MTCDHNFDTFKDAGRLEKKHCIIRGFGNIVIALELARRYMDQGIVSTSVNPETVVTDLPRHLESFILKIFLVRSIAKCSGSLGLIYVRN
jgi:retinol dehydrogenase 12